MEYNCGFKEGNRWFRYRAAAIIVEDNCVLFAGNEKADYTGIEHIITDERAIYRKDA